MNVKDYREDNKAFMVYKDWEELVNALDSDEEAGVLFKALFAFASRGERPQLEGALRMAFIVMTRQIERDGEKWEERCERNAENGRKGGRPRKATDKTKTERFSKKAGKADTDKDTDTDKDKDTDTEKERDKDITAVPAGPDGQAGPCGPAPSPAPTRHRYGEYDNVLLSDEELEALKTELPDSYRDYIERLSEYMASSGKRYKSHLATIRSWAREDKDKHPSKPEPSPKETSYKVDDWERFAMGYSFSASGRGEA